MRSGSRELQDRRRRRPVRSSRGPSARSPRPRLGSCQPAVHGKTSSVPSYVTERPATSSRMTTMASSSVVIVVGGLPSTRRAESPRPIPRSMRPPDSSSRSARLDAVTDGSRVAGFVTQVPSRSRGRRLGHQREEGIRVAPQDVAVEQPAVGEAGVLRLARQGERPLDRVVRLQREPEVHPSILRETKWLGCPPPRSRAARTIPESRISAAAARMPPRLWPGRRFRVGRGPRTRRAGGRGRTATSGGPG